jgi:hypothetical protein
MKKLALVLLALLALVPFAQAMAQTPAPAAPAKPTAAPVPDAATARFLATLAVPQAQAPSGLTPAPLLTTGCGNGPACSGGQICCFLCGAFPDGDPSGCYGCITPVSPKGCPIVE